MEVAIDYFLLNLVNRKVFEYSQLLIIVFKFEMKSYG